MKKIVALTVIIAGFLQGNALIAADDVYDAPVQKKAKIKQTYSEPSQPVPAESERTVPYTEENSSTARGSSFNDNSDYRVTDENLYSDDYSGSSFGYTDRIRRFHNPSIQFNYGWNNWSSNYYDPWNTYNNQFGWNNWNSYSFTPSWTYGYNNFYNPFWNSSAIVIIQPGFNSWYNTGFYNPWNSWSNWNNYGWNGFSPYCSNAIFNNGFSNYNGYYDYNKKNVVYTPRTGTYGNSSASTGTRNYNSGGSSNTNAGSWNVSNNNNTNTNSSNATNNNNSGSTKTNKWSNNNSNTNSNNSGGWSNPYKNNNSNTNNNYNSQPSNNNNNWNNSNSNSNSNGNSNSNSSGIKIGSRPK